MSVTNLIDTGDDVDTDDPDLFVERIQQNPNVCSNCFRRTHVRFRLTHRYQTYDGELVCEEVDGEAYPKPRRARKGVTVRDVFPADQAASTHETNRCPCGAYSNYTTLRPLDKDRLIEYGQRVAEEFNRQEDVRFDDDAFFDTLRELKSNPDRQFEDDSIFTEAVSVAAIIRPSPNS